MTDAGDGAPGGAAPARAQAPASPPPQPQPPPPPPPLPPPPLAPRAYQEELIRRALRGNVIAVLETGSGKTLIAAEVVRRMAPALAAARRRAVFLAPTNALVAQQWAALARKHGVPARALRGGGGGGGGGGGRARRARAR